jgi:hypothetical protein
MAIQSASVLKKSVLFRAGELTDGTSPYDSKALEYINQIYRSVLAGGNEFEVELGQPWVWARALQPATIVLKPKYSTGTVTVSNGATGATLSVASIESMAGQWFKVVGRPEVFRITAHSAGNIGLTLDTPYTDESGSGLSFEIYRIEYDLPGKIERLIGPMMVDRQQMLQAPMDGLINAVDSLNMAEAYPIKYIPEEIPQQFTQIQKTSSGGIRVKFNASVGSETRVSFDYIPKFNSLVTATVVTVAGNMFSLNDHGLKNNDEVIFDRTSGNINKDTSYYVINATQNTFMVAYSPGSSNVPLAVGVTYVVDSIPVIPEPFRLILDYGASFYLLTDKNDERADSYAALCKAKMLAMISANDRELSQSSGGRVGQMIPRLDMYSGPRRYWKQEPS